MSLSLCFVLSSPSFLFSFPFVFYSFRLKRAKRNKKKATGLKYPKEPKAPKNQIPQLDSILYHLYIAFWRIICHLPPFYGNQEAKGTHQKKAAGLYIHHLSEPDVEMRFSWVKDLAPLVVHVHLDKHLGCLFLLVFCRGSSCGVQLVVTWNPQVHLWELSKKAHPLLLGHLFFWVQKNRSKDRGSKCSWIRGDSNGLKCPQGPLMPDFKTHQYRLPPKTT